MPGAPADRACTLLVVSPMLYHPHCGNGGGVLCFETLRRLAERASVHFVGFSSGAADEAQALAALRSVAASVTTVPLPRAWTSWLGALGGPLSLAWQVVSAVPREVLALRSPQLRATLRDLAARVQPDAAILQFPHMAQFADALPGVPVIVDVQDACMVSRYREWRVGGGGALRGLRLLHSWWTWARFEVRSYGRAQRLMALSDTDLGVLRAFVPQVPAFLSAVAWDPAPAAAAVAPGSQAVLFMGNFAHPPNADGLQWLLAEVWPRVRARCPGATLQVAGMNLPAGFGSDAQAGVQSLGFVADVQPLLAQAALSLVPYRFGGGIKIKAIESMARGCPLVTTSVGSEGLGAQDRVHLRVADTAADYADAIVDLLQQPAERHALAERALALVAARFSWQAKMDALMREIAALLRERAGPLAGAAP